MATLDIEISHLKTVPVKTLDTPSQSLICLRFLLFHSRLQINKGYKLDYAENRQVFNKLYYILDYFALVTALHTFLSESQASQVVFKMAAWGRRAGTLIRYFFFHSTLQNSTLTT